jgi:hypothetical protein
MNITIAQGITQTRAKQIKFVGPTSGEITRRIAEVERRPPAKRKM